MSRKKVALIGLGGDAARNIYLPLLAHHPSVDLTAVMSPSYETAESMAAQYRIEKKYNDIEMLMNLELDAVFISGPTASKYSTVMECLQSGLHVYVDKPLSYEIDQSIRMIETAEKHGVLLAVGFNRRFAPRYVEAKEWFEDVGGFDHCIIQRHTMTQPLVKAKHSLYDDLISLIDVLLWLGYGVQEITSTTDRIGDDGRLMHISGALSFGKSSGFFSMNRWAGADMESLELHGGGRSAHISNLEKGVFYDKQQGKIEKYFDGWDAILYRKGYQGAVDHFIEMLATPHQCLIRGEQVLDTHLLIEKLSK